MKLQPGIALSAKKARSGLFLLIFLIPQIAAPGAGLASAKDASSGRQCQKLVFTGEVIEGQSWETTIGHDWIFRVLPIAASSKGYSGWDLAVDRAHDGGYPDALLLGTPPYGSLNEREIGTTFGLRAQDAIAWAPRRFHFLISGKDLHRGRELFRTVMAQPVAGKADEMARSKATAELLQMVGDSSRVASGKFEVLDARLTAGVADPPAFAQQWAARFSRAPHTLMPAASHPSAQGELRWIRFRATLWLPENWRTPQEIKGEQAKCPE